VLSDDELAVVWRAAGQLGYPFGSLYQALMLTGQRRSEICEARRSEVKDGVLTIPAERMGDPILQLLKRWNIISWSSNN
jgi:integrase